jgi:hypothetical protein
MWTVPNEISSNCKLRIDVVDCEAYRGNKTSGVFSIAKHVKPNPPPAQDHNIVIKVVQAGDWTSGSSGDISDNVGHTIPIQAEVKSSDGISAVQLLYKNVGDTEYSNADMTIISGDSSNGVWLSNIPAQNTKGLVICVVHATSVKGTDASTPPLYITVGGEQQPTGQFVLMMDDTALFIFGGIAVAVVVAIYYMNKKRMR